MQSPPHSAARQTSFFAPPGAVTPVMPVTPGRHPASAAAAKLYCRGERAHGERAGGAFTRTLSTSLTLTITLNLTLIINAHPKRSRSPSPSASPSP